MWLVLLLPTWVLGLHFLKGGRKEKDARNALSISLTILIWEVGKVGRPLVQASLILAPFQMGHVTVSLGSAFQQSACIRGSRFYTVDLKDRFSSCGMQWPAFLSWQWAEASICYRMSSILQCSLAEL